MRSFDSYFLDNRWQPASGEELLTIVEPVGERPTARLRACSRDDVHRAVASAQRGFAAWAGSALDQRREALAAIAAALRAREAELLDALAEELGAPLALSRMLHLPMPLKGLELIGAGLDQVRWEEEIGNARVAREPVGVIAGITPWNAPLHQMVAKVAGAIGAGCAMVLKPSELVPRVSELFFEAIAEAGLPDGVVNLVWGGPEVGEALVEHPGVDMVSFTGSDTVGRRVMRAAADGLKRVALELGGKSAALLLEDADLATAVPAVVRQSMANSGQTCVCQSRLLVPRRRLTEAEALARAAAEAIRLGDPRAQGTMMGPVRTQAQFERASRMIENALTQGARLVTGGPGRALGFEMGYFIAPTVLSDVRPEMEIAQEEVFAPVLAVLPYEDEEEAVAIANGTRFGLSGAIWSADATRAEALARRLRTGQVIVNGAPQNLATPFGGFGHSGFGRENGRFSIEAFLEYKSVQGVV